MIKVIKIQINIILAITVLLVPSFSYAAQMGEASVMGAYSKTHYGGNAYSTTKRYTVSLAVNLTRLSEIEIAFINSDTYINNDPVETTSINDQILSFSLVQSFVPADWITQLYGKAGAAQYNRKKKGTINGIPSPETYSKSPSALVGMGIKIIFLQRFSLKVEGVSYLPDLKFKQLSNNFSVQGGLGWHF